MTAPEKAAARSAERHEQRADPGPAGARAPTHLQALVGLGHLLVQGGEFPVDLRPRTVGYLRQFAAGVRGVDRGGDGVDLLDGVVGRASSVADA